MLVLDLLLSLHILIVVFAFAFTAGVGILASRVARSRDARAIHAVFAAAQPLATFGGIGWIVAGALGAWIAAKAGIPFDSPWLLGSYAALAVLVGSGLALHAPWMTRVIRASAGSGDGTVSAELDALLRSPVSSIASAVSGVCFVALIYLMTARPG